jgi:antitoxin component YwqK of YwqJK toxin-antitoxin module
VFSQKTQTIRIEDTSQNLTMTLEVIQGKFKNKSKQQVWAYQPIDSTFVLAAKHAKKLRVPHGKFKVVRNKESALSEHIEGSFVNGLMHGIWVVKDSLYATLDTFWFEKGVEKRSVQYSSGSGSGVYKSVYESKGKRFSAGTVVKMYYKDGYISEINVSESRPNTTKQTDFTNTDFFRQSVQNASKFTKTILTENMQAISISTWTEREWYILTRENKMEKNTFLFRDGPYKIFHENGKLAESGRYFFDLLTDTVKIYDENEEEITALVYKIDFDHYEKSGYMKSIRGYQQSFESETGWEASGTHHWFANNKDTLLLFREDFNAGKSVHSGYENSFTYIDERNRFYFFAPVEVHQTPFQKVFKSNELKTEQLEKYLNRSLNQLEILTAVKGQTGLTIFAEDIKESLRDSLRDEVFYDKLVTELMLTFGTYYSGMNRDELLLRKQKRSETIFWTANFPDKDLEFSVREYYAWVYNNTFYLLMIDCKSSHPEHYKEFIQLSRSTLNYFHALNPY